MRPLFLAFVLVLIRPVVCRAFVVDGRQGPVRDVLQVLHKGRGSLTAVGMAFVSAGALGAQAAESTTVGAARSASRVCRAAPRAVPPLVHSSGPRDGSLTPLSAINPDTLNSANDWIAGVAGGSVGVLGTLIQLELKQEKLKTRRNCPYCDGSGKLVCAQCCSAGTISVKLPGSDVYSSVPCPACDGKGYIDCLNCRGDGRAVPRELERKTADAAEVDLKLEEIGMGQ